MTFLKLGELGENGAIDEEWKSLKNLVASHVSQDILHLHRGHEMNTCLMG